MSLFYGVCLTRFEFFTMLVQKDDTFTVQLLDYIQTRAKDKDDPEWHAALGYTRADVLLDLEDNDSRIRPEKSIYASICVRDLMSEIRVVRSAPNKNQDVAKPEMQVSLWSGLDINDDMSPPETYLVGQHIHVYSDDLVRSVLPDIKPIKAALAQFFPDEKAAFY